jgi:hypothetical protein
MRPEAQLGPAMKTELGDGCLCFPIESLTGCTSPQVRVNVHLALLSTASWYAVKVAFLHFPCNQATNQKFCGGPPRFPPTWRGARSALPMSHPHTLKHPAVFRASFGLFEWFRSVDGLQSSRRDALCSVQANSFEASMRCES